MLKKMAGYSVAVLRRVIENKEIMSAMDKPKRERKKSLDTFFSPKRFRWSDLLRVFGFLKFRN
jgi:hypothetical protein